MIRPFKNQDFAARLAMFERDPGTLPSSPSPQVSQQVIEQLFPALHRSYPLKIEGVHSLVDVNSDGEMAGMLGILPRRFQFRDRTLSAAISVELITGSATGGWMTGVKLLKALFDGQQDLAISDLANTETRKLWQRLGGEVIGAYNWNWLKVLRPASTARWVAESRGAPGVLCSLAKPVCGLVDRLAVRSPRYRFNPEHIVPLSSDTFAAELAALTPESLAPLYSRVETRWVWQRLDYIWRAAGDSTQCAVCDDDGQTIGWFIYQGKPGYPARVAHISALPGSEESVLRALFATAESAGACALTGRVQPRFNLALADFGCLLTARETPLLVHSAREDVMQAIRGGDFAFTLLDGEGPAQLWNNPQAALAAVADLQLIANEPIPSLHVPANRD